jgi:hypothetical protein
LYVKKQWIEKRSIGPDRLSVRDDRSRTNNVLESYHSALRRRIVVSHPNLFTFLGHLQRATVDSMKDLTRITNGLKVRRSKKKANVQNDQRIKSCISRYDGGFYTKIQFLRAVSHSLGTHTPALLSNDHQNDSDCDDDEQSMPIIDDNSSTPEASQQPQQPAVGTAVPVSNVCDVCLNAERSRIALVPCGHSTFCQGCVNTLQSMSSQCPICRSVITMVLTLY